MPKIFQYPSRFEPLGPIVSPATGGILVPCVYPDTVPHRRSRLMPAVFGPVLFTSSSELRDSQNPVESLYAYDTAAVRARESQQPVETLFIYASSVLRARASQISVEILYPAGCFVFHPSVPAPPACPVDLAPDPNTAPCADEAPDFL